MSVNIKIKAFGLDGDTPKVATEKFFLRGAAETAAGCRWLEPGEVVTIEDEAEASTMLKNAGNFIEITMEPANRPMFFRSAIEADRTSRHQPASLGRADKAKEEMARIFEEMKRDAEAKDDVTTPRSDLDDKMAEMNTRQKAIEAREIELGLRKDPNALEQKLDDELKGYEPTNNTVTAADLETTREAARKEADKEAKKEATSAKAKASPSRKRRG